MQLPPSLTPCQKLQQAWTEFNAASAPETKSQKQIEMIHLLKEQILEFNGRDAAELRELARSVCMQPRITNELLERVTRLADRIQGFSPPQLPSDLYLSLLSFIPPTQRFGMHCSNKFLGALTRNPVYLASIVNNAEHPIPLDRLEALLKKCGEHVIHLDLSRLLSREDRGRLQVEQLKTFVSQCPHLQSLIVYQAHLLEMGDLPVIAQKSELRELIVADCRKIPVDPLQTTPNLRVCFSTANLDKPMTLGMRLHNYFQLPQKIREELNGQYYAIHSILCRGMSLQQYCKLDDPTREYLIRNHHDLRNVTTNGTTMESFCRMSLTERTSTVDEANRLEDLKLCVDLYDYPPSFDDYADIYDVDDG